MPLKKVGLCWVRKMLRKISSPKNKMLNGIVPTKFMQKLIFVGIIPV